MTIEQIIAKLQEITAEGETRSLTTEEVTEYEALEGQLKAAQKTQELRSRTAAYIAPSTTLQAAVHVATPKADDAELRAFDHYVRTADASELRAQSVGTPAAGGFTVPETFLQKLVDVRKSFGGIQSVAEVLNTERGEQIHYPVINDTANSGVQVDELTAPASGGADLVFSEVTLGSYRYAAPGAGNNPLRVSEELLLDSTYDVQGLVARKLGERIERTVASKFASGTGTDEPRGILNGTAQSATPTYDSLVDAVHSVDVAYRDGAVFVLNDVTVALLEKLKDLDGRPLLNAHNDGINVGRSNQTLLGYPVVIDNSVPYYQASGLIPWAVFGNVREGFIIRRVTGATRLIVNPYTAANDGAVEYTLHVRVDSTIQNAHAFRVLTGPAS